MSTESDLPYRTPASRSSDFNKLVLTSEDNNSKDDPKDQQIAALQREAEDLKNKHSEDKFIWFLAATAMFDVAALLHVENWTGPLVIGVIELIAIIVMANRCKVDVVAPLIDKIIGMVPAFKGKTD